MCLCVAVDVCICGCPCHSVYLFTIDAFVSQGVSECPQHLRQTWSLQSVRRPCGEGFSVSVCLGVCAPVSVVECAFVSVV